MLSDKKKYAEFPVPQSSHYAALGGLFLLAALLRLWAIGKESAWLDEVLTLPHLGAPNLAEFWRQATAADTSWQLTPVYYLLEYAWAQCFGAELLIIRLFSCLCGLISVLLLYDIGKKLFSPKVGLMAALFLALSLPHIFYSQEVRRYAWVLMINLLSFDTLFRSHQNGYRPQWWTAHLMVNFLLAWSSPYSAPTLCAQAIYLFLTQRIPWPRFLLWAGINTLAFILLALWILSLDIQALFWIPLPGLRELLNTFLVLAGGRFSNDNPAAYLPGGLSLDIPLAVLIYTSASGALLASIVAKQLQRHRQLLFITALWFVTAPLIWFLFSQAWKPCFLYRYFLFTSPPLFLMAATGINSLPRRRLRIPLFLLILGLFLFQNTVRLHGPFRPDYASAAHWAQSSPERNELPLLILKPWLNGTPMRYLDSLDEKRFHYAESAGDLHKKTHTLVEKKGGCLVIMWRWDRRGDFEAFLDSNNMAWTLQALGGMPPLYTYQVTQE